MSAPSTHKRLLIFVVPFDSNPYQEALYGPMRSAQFNTVEIRYWRRRSWIGVPQFFPLAAWCAFRGSRLAHIHWIAWDLRIDMPGRAKISGSLCRLAIWWLQLLRFRIIWTVHNVLPHEPQTDNDLAIIQSIARVSSAIVVHSVTTLESLANELMPTDRAVVIPQGNYIGRYGDPPSSEEARRSLALPPSGRVVLFFGLIRPYKGVLDLLQAWSEAPDGAALIIVGSCPDPALQEAIQLIAARDTSVVLRLDFVPDDEVSTYFGACDCVCLPFRDTTTSSSALLALSFAKPLVAPRLGSLRDLPDEVGYFYDSEVRAGLDDALKRFLTDDDSNLRRHAKAGRNYAKTFSWPTIAEQTAELYRAVAAQPRVRSAAPGPPTPILPK